MGLWGTGKKPFKICLKHPTSRCMRWLVSFELQKYKHTKKCINLDRFQ
jgi:hypothetical protein